jgi:hypothetical protein
VPVRRKFVFFILLFALLWMQWSLNFTVDGKWFLILLISFPHFKWRINGHGICSWGIIVYTNLAYSDHGAYEPSLTSFFSWCHLIRKGFNFAACRDNLLLLRTRYYYATWKADGTRYMMLITVDGCFLIDRDFKFRRVQMRFPCRYTNEVCIYSFLLLGWFL